MTLARKNQLLADSPPPESPSVSTGGGFERF
jgi:hypothetical protein